MVEIARGGGWSVTHSSRPDEVRVLLHEVLNLVEDVRAEGPAGGEWMCDNIRGRLLALAGEPSPTREAAIEAAANAMRTIPEDEVAEWEKDSHLWNARAAIDAYESALGRAEVSPDRAAEILRAVMTDPTACSCGGNGWIEDESYDHYPYGSLPTVERTYDNGGFMPCGFCNPGGFGHDPETLMPAKRRWTDDEVEEITRALSEYTPAGPQTAGDAK